MVIKCRTVLAKKWRMKKENIVLHFINMFFGINPLRSLDFSSFSHGEHDGEYYLHCLLSPAIKFSVIYFKKKTVGTD